MRNFLLSLDSHAREVFLSIGMVFFLAIRGLHGVFTRPFDPGLVLQEADNIGTKSLFLVNTIALFSGMVLALQGVYTMRRYGAELYVGSLVSLTLVRELGPVLTAIMVGGRAGSGMAAEIGSMQVTEQIDAMRALGANPVKKLVTPRMLAAMITLPLLTVSADVVGIFGGLVIALIELPIDTNFYLNTIWTTVTINDFLSGIGKTIFFGFLIALFGCYYGLYTKGGTTGVGRSTTMTVVTVSIAVLISDFFLTKIFLLF
ncbi:MAG: MlaE family ABC transporter permease [Candidatus Brocadiales bacterium]